ncbi:MAG: hypothetical protein M3020_09995 [Myxococcota bacterium]|nr:hypothetical protein [Myxococcota bacterium]
MRFCHPFALVSLLLPLQAAACERHGSSFGPQTTHSERAVATAPSASSSTPSVAPPPVDPKLSVERSLIDAADADLGGLPSDYRALAASAGVNPRLIDSLSPLRAVAEGLAALKTPGALAALARWAANPRAALHNRVYAFLELSKLDGFDLEPYLPAFEAVLLEPDFGSIVVNVTGLRGALAKQLISYYDNCTAQCEALRLLRERGGERGLALVRRIAEDRSRSEPNAAAIASFDCGSGMDREVAQALTSERLLALSVLDDPELLARVAADPTEPPLIRRWSRRMLKGPPYPLHPQGVVMGEPGLEDAAPCRMPPGSVMKHPPSGVRSDF